MTRGTSRRGKGGNNGFHCKKWKGGKRSRDKRCVSSHDYV